MYIVYDQHTLGFRENIKFPNVYNKIKHSTIFVKFSTILNWKSLDLFYINLQKLTKDMLYYYY